MTTRPPDPDGVFERPDTGPMTRMADHLRGLLIGVHEAEYFRATITASVDIMELQTDWLVRQHQMLESQQRLIDQQTDVIAAQGRVIDDLKGE